jgi:hypothetical protein
MGRPRRRFRSGRLIEASCHPDSRSKPETQVFLRDSPLVPRPGGPIGANNGGLRNPLEGERLRNPGSRLTDVFPSDSRFPNRWNSRLTRATCLNHPAWARVIGT